MGRKNGEPNDKKSSRGNNPKFSRKLNLAWNRNLLKFAAFALSLQVRQNFLIFLKQACMTLKTWTILAVFVKKHKGRILHRQSGFTIKLENQRRFLLFFFHFFRSRPTIPLPTMKKPRGFSKIKSKRKFCEQHGTGTVANLPKHDGKTQFAGQFVVGALAINDRIHEKGLDRFIDENDGNPRTPFSIPIIPSPTSPPPQSQPRIPSKTINPPHLLQAPYLLPAARTHAPSRSQTQSRTNHACDFDSSEEDRRFWSSPLVGELS